MIIKDDIIWRLRLENNLIEIGDSERLPSMCTCKLLKVPKYILINNHVMICDHTMSKEMVSLFTCTHSSLIAVFVSR